MSKIEIKSKTFFQIPPTNAQYHELLSDRVVFMDQGFGLTNVYYIGECVQVGDLWYQFSIYLARPERKIDFDFKRKADCLMAQRELARAWTRTGEFSYEDVDAGESSAVQ